MTFAKFERMPDDGRRYELRNGEPIDVPPATHRHFLIRRRLRQLLESAAGGAGVVATAWGFRPTADYEYRIADVAFVSLQRERAIPPDGYLMGAPELVIDIESEEKERLCIENGCLEFWVIDPKRRSVEVSTPDGPSMTYATGQQIALMFGGELAVDAIFE
jgi:Uma2 family endonuclease